MPRILDPVRFVLMAAARWMNQRQLRLLIISARRTGFSIAALERTRKTTWKEFLTQHWELSWTPTSSP